MPVTIRRTHTVFGDSFRTKFKNAIMGSTVWLRPRKNNLQQMKWLVDYVVESQTDYIMFMLHSSEMMPGGSPTFQTKEDIEKLYADIAVLFKHMSKEYEGSTLKEYYKYKSGK